MRCMNWRMFGENDGFLTGSECCAPVVPYCQFRRTVKYQRSSSHLHYTASVKAYVSYSKPRTVIFPTPIDGL